MTQQHSGRIGQTLIYIGKLFRMFVFRNDWKVIPMAAIIAALVSYVVSGTLFKTMEGTLRGTFALSCICIWNGFFNSIQVVCRERPIIKREHRSGLHMSSYVCAHMVYQAFLCLCQTIIVMIVLNVSKVAFPAVSYMTGSVMLDIAITLFLSTYAADMMALFVSSIVRNTTTAMTVMPFLMIFQLIFSGGFFSLQGAALQITNFTISKWSLSAMCAQGEYNSLPNGAILTAISKMSTETIDNKESIIGNIKETDDIDINAALDSLGTAGENITLPVLPEEMLSDIRKYLDTEENRDRFTQWCGRMSYDPKFESSPDNIAVCWLMISVWAVVFAGASVISLEFIDKDKR